MTWSWRHFAYTKVILSYFYRLQYYSIILGVQVLICFAPPVWLFWTVLSGRMSLMVFAIFFLYEEVIWIKDKSSIQILSVKEVLSFLNLIHLCYFVKQSMLMYIFWIAETIKWTSVEIWQLYSTLEFLICNCLW